MTKKPSLLELLSLVSGLMRERSIRHTLIGGLAVALRGYPRATVDLDLLVDGADSERITACLEEAGFDLHFESKELMQFGGLGAVDLLLAHRPASLKMLDDATTVEHVPAPVARVEDIVGLKIQAYHNDPRRKWKDQADIAELIRANPSMDWDRVLGYADLFGAREEVTAIREGVLR